VAKPVYKSKINLSVGFLTVATLLNTWNIVPPEYQAQFLETVNLVGAALIFYFRTWRTGTPLTWGATPITDSGEEANRRD
jgi:hypothetical protein